MCVICNSAENKISITGLNGKICKSCHENILLIRQNHLKEAGEYFSGIDFASAESRKFIENEFSKKEFLYRSGKSFALSICRRKTNFR